METWGVVFLGVIAAAMVVQAAFIIELARAGTRLGRRLDELQVRLDREIQPALENLGRASRNVGEISDLATHTAHRAADTVAGALDRVEEGVVLLQRFLLRPLGPLTNVVALLRGLQQGLRVYQQLGAMESTRRGTAQHYRDDEHLFI